MTMFFADELERFADGVLSAKDTFSDQASGEGVTEVADYEVSTGFERKLRARI